MFRITFRQSAISTALLLADCVKIKSPVIFASVKLSQKIKVTSKTSPKQESAGFFILTYYLILYLYTKARIYGGRGVVGCVHSPRIRCFELHARKVPMKNFGRAEIQTRVCYHLCYTAPKPKHSLPCKV